MPTIDEDEALDGIERALEDANSTDRCLLGIADHIPIEAEPARIAAVARRIRSV